MANYYKEFLRSPAHAWTALVTVGIGLASANPIGMIVGAAAYALAWIYFPDSKGFKARIDKIRQAQQMQKEKSTEKAWEKQRAELLEMLDRPKAQRFSKIQGLCGELAALMRHRSAASLYPMETLAANLEEIQLTVLRLLGQQQRLTGFLSRENAAEIDDALKNIQSDNAELEKEIARLEAEAADANAIATRRRTLELQLDRMETLKQRKNRLTQAGANLDLVDADLDRIEDHLKLLLADATSQLDSSAFSHHIDSSMRHLSQTNHWLGELESFEAPSSPVAQ